MDGRRVVDTLGLTGAVEAAEKYNKSLKDVGITHKGSLRLTRLCVIGDAMSHDFMEWTSYFSQLAFLYPRCSPLSTAKDKKSSCVIDTGHHFRVLAAIWGIFNGLLDLLVMPLWGKGNHCHTGNRPWK